MSKHRASSSWCTWGFYLRARCCPTNLSLHFWKDTSPLQVPRRMRGDVLLLGFQGFVPTALWDPKRQTSGPHCPAHGHYKALFRLQVPFPSVGLPRGLSFRISMAPHTVAGEQGQSWSKDGRQGWEGNWQFPEWRAAPAQHQAAVPDLDQTLGQVFKCPGRRPEG